MWNPLIDTGPKKGGRPPKVCRSIAVHAPALQKVRHNDNLLGFDEIERNLPRLENFAYRLLFFYLSSGYSALIA